MELLRKGIYTFIVSVHSKIFESMKFFILICFIILIAGCRNEGSLFERMEKRFHDSEGKLKALVDSLNDSKNNSYFSEMVSLRNSEEFSPSIAHQLKSAGIKNVAQQYGGCKRPIYIFETYWIANDSVLVAYNCDTVETRKGFYKKDKNSNEIWGLGNSWQVIKIVKYLDTKE